MTSSVVVLSYRPGDWLGPCLASVADQADEVVLVDNGSDGSAASAVGRRVGVRVVRSPVNLGFAGGVNLGVRQSSGDLVALLNDDAVADPGWMAASADALGPPDVAAVTPKVLLAGRWREVRLDDEPWRSPRYHRSGGRRIATVLADGVDVTAAIRGPGLHYVEAAAPDRPAIVWTRPGVPIFVPVAGSGATVTVDGEAVGGEDRRLVNKAGSALWSDGTLGDIGEGEVDDGSFDTGGDRFFASGTAMVFRRETFERVGGLAEPLFAYYEDADWSWRARLAGLRIVYDPSSAVEHRQSATSGGGASRWVKVAALRNHLLCLARNAPMPSALAVTREQLPHPDPYAIHSAYRRMLPWALASRGRMSRHWQLSPGEVWDRWVGRTS